MAAINRSTATDNFSNQLAAYNQYVASISSAPVALPSVEEIAEQLSEPVTEAETAGEPDQAEPEQAAVDEVVPEEEQPPAVEPVAATDDQVADQSRLSIGQESGSEDLAAAASGQLGDSAQVDALKTQLAQLDETMLVSGEENTALRQQLEEMQAQVDRLSRLLEVEDTGLTLAQNQAADSQSAATDTGLTEQSGQSQGEMNLEEPNQDEQTQDEQPVAGDEADLAEPEDGTASLDTAGLAPVQPVAAPSSSLTAEDVTEGEGIEVTKPGTETGSGQAEETEPAGMEAAEEDTTGVSDAVKSDAVTPATEADQDLGEDASEEAGEGDSNRQVVDTSIMDAITGMFSSLGSVLGSFSDYALKIAAALIALLAGLFFYRRHRSQREFEESMLDIESEQISSNSELASLQRLSAASGIDLASQNSGLDLTVGGGMSFLSEDGVSGVTEEENEVIQAGVVDPLAEADVYLAYDRDEQAIQVLKEAYANNPERMELAEKLLEIYHKQDDRRAFDALAAELHRRMGSGTSSEWVNIAAMGREVSPGNALYTTDSDDMDISTGDDGMIQFGGDSENAGIDLDPTPGTGAEELDLVDVQSQDTAVKNLIADDIDMDAEDPDEEMAVLDTPTLSQIIQGPVSDKMVVDKVGDRGGQIEPEGEEQSIDIDIDTDEIEAGPMETMQVDQLVPMDSADESSKPELPADDAVQKDQPAGDGDERSQTDAQTLDEDSFLSEMSEQSMSQLEPYHESETALELAKAYIELGEKDIAKGFIEEVINEGSDKQKQKAEKLVKDLTD
jgi:pilus assembly protein FimV